ncbi:MAG: RNA polymerase sigma factor, partial [Pseudomonadota bacterium]
AYCRRLAPGAEDFGDDIAQEALVRAWTSLSQLADPARFRPWLFRIAWRCFLQQTRRRKPAFALDGNDDEAETIHGAPLTDRDVALARVDLERALARLKPEERAAITLCLSYGHSHGEAADMLDMPLGTVKSHVLRGRETLQRHLTGWRQAGRRKQAEAGT